MLLPHCFLSRFCVSLNIPVLRPYFLMKTLDERPVLPQGTNIQIFPHKIGWEGTPAFFCLNTTDDGLAEVVVFDDGDVMMAGRFFIGPDDPVPL